MSDLMTPGTWRIARAKGRPYQIEAVHGAGRGERAIAITRWAAIARPSTVEAEANAQAMCAAKNMVMLLREFRDFAGSGQSFGYPPGSLDRIQRILSVVEGK